LSSKARRKRGPLLALGLAVIVAAVAVAVLGGASAGAGNEVRLLGSTVKPKRAFFDSVEGIRITFRLDSSEPVDASVRIRRGGAEVKRFRFGRVSPGAFKAVVWNGITKRGKAAKDGAYRVFVKPEGSGPLRAGRFWLRGHIYPVRGPHTYRGAIGEFGAPRSGGRIHEGFDINAACKTKLVAVRSGKVVKRGYDPVLYGNFLLIAGRKQRRTYFYSHLIKPAAPKRGELVKTGQRVGKVGRTGNARYVPGCHLHFEIRRRGRPIDPEPHLRLWDAYS
jgi:murein DD-endopeptidase MepM/ murein hydrolase activator NlpD